MRPLSSIPEVTVTQIVVNVALKEGHGRAGGLVFLHLEHPASQPLNNVIVFFKYT